MEVSNPCSLLWSLLVGYLDVSAEWKDIHDVRRLRKSLPGMMNSTDGSTWNPVASQERYVSLDILRGLALLGVLLVNLESDFRVPLAQHILVFHTDHSGLDCAADIAVAGLLEF